MSHNTSYCLIEVITKADLPNSEWFCIYGTGKLNYQVFTQTYILLY